MSLTEKYIHVSIPKKLIIEHEKMDLSLEETMILIKILSIGKERVDLLEITKELEIPRDKVIEFSSKNIINIEEDEGHIVINVAPLYEKMYEQKINCLTNSQIIQIEKVFGRKIKKNELNKINEWLKNDVSIDKILLAIQKAIVNNADNINYIETIINNEEKQPKSNVERKIEFY